MLRFQSPYCKAGSTHRPESPKICACESTLYVGPELNPVGDPRPCRFLHVSVVRFVPAPKKAPNVTHWLPWFFVCRYECETGNIAAVANSLLTAVAVGNNLSANLARKAIWPSWSTSVFHLNEGLPNLLCSAREGSPWRNTVLLGNQEHGNSLVTRGCKIAGTVHTSMSPDKKKKKKQ
jgi:hypothetical protein